MGILIFFLLFAGGGGWLIVRRIRRILRKHRLDRTAIAAVHKIITADRQLYPIKQSG
jgi:hypothetical protein